MQKETSELLSIRQIAGWQIPDLAAADDTIRAALPALQRGAVWQPRQVEELWDSLFRGFPVGAFLLAPFDEQRGAKEWGLPSGAAATHHLLDGQQRSNAITLGFLNPWAPNAKPAPAALWLDLAAPPANDKDDREFVFRVLSRAHPWGYRYQRLAEGGSRLTAHQIREASAAYRAKAPAGEQEEGQEIPIARAWPWDAKAPVPVALLLLAVRNGGDVRSALMEELARLPFWTEESRNLHGPKWTKRVTDLLSAMTGSHYARIERVLAAMATLLATHEGPSYRIPLMVLPRLSTLGAGVVQRRPRTEEEAEYQDPVETLFIRVNSAGTPLAGEELIYSILKSTWPEAEQFIHAMDDVRLAVPSRIVTLASRLVLADEKGYQDRPPVTLDVARFRRLIRGVDRDCPSFRKKLVNFFQKKRAEEIFHAAGDLLMKNPYCKLPPVVAFDAARRSQDTLFLLLRWIDRMRADGQDVCAMKEAPTRRVLGAFTALSWFAEREGQCLSHVWQKLQVASGSGLKAFFASNFLPHCLKLSTTGKIGLLPLPPPKVLEDAVRASVLGYGFKAADGHHWNNWTWESLTDRALLHKKGETGLHRWYRLSAKAAWTRAVLEEEGDGDTVLQERFHTAWSALLNRLWEEKGLLLFAQRDWLVQWFPSFDPTSPDQREEADRPWDFDHIHPSAHVERRRNVPELVRAWHGSIGNLRAWPLQANRGDGACSPRVKLAEEAVEALQPFKIGTHDHLLEASFISREDAYEDWCNAAPSDPPPGYLGWPDTYGEHRKRVVKAIVERWLRLYRTWYEELRVGELSH